MEPFRFGREIIWRRSEIYVAPSRLKHFMDRHRIAVVAELHEKIGRESRVVLERCAGRTPNRVLPTVY
jgi:hypothetical protein